MVLMKKPSVIDAPSGGAPEQAPRWDLVGTEGCGGGIRVLAPLPIVWGYLGIYIGGRSTSVEQHGAHEGGGRAWGVGAPLPRGLLFCILTLGPSLPGLVC